MNEGFIQKPQSGTGSMEDSDGQGEAGGTGAPVKFELSEKGSDFLGYRALRELMGALDDRPSALTTPRIFPPGSTPAALPNPTSSVTPSIWT